MDPDFNHAIVTRLEEVNRDIDSTSLGRKLECVALKVEQYLLQSVLVSADKIVIVKAYILDAKFDFFVISFVLLNVDDLFHHVLNVDHSAVLPELVGVDLSQ